MFAWLFLGGVFIGGLKLMRFVMMEAPRRVLAFIGCLILAVMLWLYRKRISNSNVNGGQAAATILAANGLSVPVYRGEGWLSDCYLVKEDRILLSPGVFDGTSVGALGVAAHEAGHALQAHSGSMPWWLMRLSSPLAAVAFGLSFWIWLIGSTIEDQQWLLVALGCLGVYLLYLIVELVCEVDASRRGLKELCRLGLVRDDESLVVRRVLGAALATYLAALGGVALAAAAWFIPSIDWKTALAKEPNPYDRNSIIVLQKVPRPPAPPPDPYAQWLEQGRARIAAEHKRWKNAPWVKASDGNANESH